MKKIIIETAKGAEIVEVPDDYQEMNKEKTLVTIEVSNDCEVKM